MPATAPRAFVFPRPSLSPVTPATASEPARLRFTMPAPGVRRAFRRLYVYEIRARVAATRTGRALDCCVLTRYGRRIVTATTVTTYAEAVAWLSTRARARGDL